MNARAADDLLYHVSEAIAATLIGRSGKVDVGELAQAAIDAVRRHDAAKVVPFLPLTTGSDGMRTVKRPVSGEDR